MIKLTMLSRDRLHIHIGTDTNYMNIVLEDDALIHDITNTFESFMNLRLFIKQEWYIVDRYCDQNESIYNILRRILNVNSIIMNEHLQPIPELTDEEYQEMRANMHDDDPSMQEA